MRNLYYAQSPPDTSYDVLGALREMLRLPDCEWTSDEQRKATLFAIQRKTDLLVALPTGSGKSVIPMLAARVVNKTFAVIVPFISLLEDWERRLKLARLFYSVFKPGMRTFADTPIILATTDIAVTPGFSEAIGRSFANHTFGGLVIDEVHEVFVSREFRNCMRNIWHIRRLPFPIIAMSGTIPVNMESSLRRELCLAPDTIVCRRSCNRPELIYNIEPPVTSNDHLGKRVLDIVGKHDLGPTERGLVFVMTVGDGMQLASHLRCEFYWSMKTKVSGADSADTNTKRANLRRETVENWRRGIHKIMVATTAFATGNDFPNVWLVILATTPFDMCSAIQEMGRAGRDGNAAWCYILPNRILSLPPGQGHDDFHGCKLMSKMIWESSECIRLCLTRYVDGDMGVSCHDDHQNQVCSRCRSSQKRKIATCDFLGSPLILHQHSQDPDASPSLPARITNAIRVPARGKMLVPSSSSGTDDEPLVC